MNDRLIDPAPAGPAASAAFAVEAACHVRIEGDFAPELDDVEGQAYLLGRCIGAQVAAAWERSSPTGDLVLSSTALSAALAAPGAHAVTTRLLDGVADVCGRRPLAIFHTYMCAGWGYALRFFARHTSAARVTVAIVDVDVHNLEFRRAHPPIGRFGFGITAAVLAMPRQRDGAAQCGGPFQGSGFNELVRAMKMLHARAKPELTFMPYVLDDMIHIAGKVLGTDGLAPNRFNDYGHCFGSDTWIGLIEELIARPPDRPRSLAMGAIAFNGYFTICSMVADARTRVAFARIPGGLAALQSHINQPRALPRSPTGVPNV